ncbi:S-layer family protein [Nostoc sp. FACHB-152]|uniref:beta strand repeat-containing protein n=1 Tax=Nostoc sp. FACHB-152 TaxID=2692837 RepID=UPI001F5508F4|nr:Calx-beta domain-containing protein [Nostoc sp. FACHB-152]
MNNAYILHNNLVVESPLNIDSNILRTLEQALFLTQERLQTFANDSDFTQKMAVAFGGEAKVDFLGTAWLAKDFSIFPNIEIRNAADINGANGAYGASTNKIYLSWEFLLTNQANPENFVGLLLEEIGHRIDTVLNNTDSAGDEGAIFSALVQGESLSNAALTQLKAENDSAVININGQAIAVEQQNFTGTNGNNTITGTSGEDNINSGLGIDNVDGGAGNDLLIVDYSSNSYTGTSPQAGINSSVGSNGTGGFSGSYFAYREANNFSNYDQVSFSNIERFQITGTAANDNIRTGDGNDTIVGGAGNDTIIAGGGNDSITGGAGNDIITGGTGINIIDGGEGTDTLIDADFSSATSSLNIDDTTSKTINIADGTSVTNVELFTNLTTGSGNDVISFTQRNNNTINTGSGEDNINSGLGSDNVDGGAGNDLLIVDYSSNSYTGTSAGISSSAGSNGTGGFNGSYFAYRNTSFNYDQVSFSNIERFQITGTAANDNIRTGDGNDTIVGGAGNDTIIAGNGNNNITAGEGNDNITSGSGNDSITGGLGNDTITAGAGINIIDGGEGTDTLVDGNFSTLTTAITFDDTGTTHAPITLADGTSVTNIELFTNLTTGSGNDVISFTQRNNNTINTGSGDDTINAGLGSDNVDGGAGNDLLIVDYSSNSYTGTSAGISSSAGSNGAGGFNGSYFAYRNTSFNYDQVSFSNIERFQITGTAANDNIRTGDGNDTIVGGAGNDTIIAGGGSDRLIGVAQNAVNPGLGEIDTLQGGAGGDIYIIGNAATTFYDDGNATTSGTADYARIVGFNASEDLIQLTGPKTNYILGTSPINGITGTAIYINKPNSEPDELIAIIEGVTGLNLNSNVFIEAQNESGLFSFSQATFSTPESNNATITITREQGTIGAANVTLALTNGTATASGDYDNSSMTVNFADGETSKTITITIVNDNIYESNETVNLTLINPTNGAALGTQKTATLTIVDNDALPGAIAFSAANYSVNEDGTPVTVVTLTRTGGSDGAVSVIVTPTNGTATASSDFISNPITVNFANGETSKTVAISVINDTVYEGNETVNLTLSNPTGGASIGTQNTAILTIVDNDALPGTLAFSSANYSINEDGTANTVVTITRTGGTNGEVSVTLTPSNGTATAPDDYSNTPITVTFANGETSKTVSIPIVNDTVYEQTETINLTLSNPTNGAALGTQTTAAISIIDNDAVPGTIAFSQATYSVNEDGTPISQVTLTRTGGSNGEISVVVTPSNGTATASDDYSNTPITVTFANGETSKTISIPIVSDSQFEANETINLSLSSATGGATIGSQNTAILTIVNDDSFLPGAIAFSGANYSVNENGTPINQITLTRTGGSDGEVSVTLNFSDGTATAASDYSNTPITVTFANGDTTSKTVTIPINNDTLAESTETFNLTLTNATGGATIGSQNTAVVSIIDDDNEVNIVGTAGNDTLIGNIANNDNIQALEGNDILSGLAGNDTLNGGTGKDTMTGGLGNDIYIVDNTADKVVENLNEGTDTVRSSINYTLGDNVENLILTGTSNLLGTGNSLNNSITGNSGNNTLNGKAGDDTLDGGAGNDILDGGVGNDVMIGGLGNDTYYVDSSSDQIIEAFNEGTDTVRVSVSWVLSSTLENLILTGTNAIDGTGNALNNSITGNIANNNLSGNDGNDNLKGNAGNDTLNGGLGNDILDGGLGDDVMIGGAGNDTYYVDSNSDQITEAFNEGTDTVRAAVTFTLGDHLENLILTGTNAIDGTGNALKNTITGNSANNNLFGGGDNDTLNGGDGNDNLEGGNGNDILTGGTGNDTLFGGVGSDKLTGGTGNDRFVFNSLGEGIDTITDFSSTDDVLVVQTLFTNLNYTGTNPIADAYIRGIQSGSNTLIQIDTDGVSSNASFSTLVTLNNFNASNFSQNNLIF